jgi:hypothetical protein
MLDATKREDQALAALPSYTVIHAQLTDAIMALAACRNFQSQGFTVFLHFEHYELINV